MSRRAERQWLDDPYPLAPAQSRRQIQNLLRFLGTRPQRILDLGCGAGRVLMPLARAGHRVTGVDRSDEALARCQETLHLHGLKARLLRADFKSLPKLARSFDVVLCLGNTLMTVADVDETVGLMTTVASVLKPVGQFIVDDVPRDFWPELTDGRWQTGLSDDGAMQMVWKPGDSVFAIRTGRRVNSKRRTLGPGDVPLRLWCDGLLTLTAGLAGLSAPCRVAGAELLVFRRLHAQSRRTRLARG